MLGLSSMLSGFITADVGNVLRARAQCVIHEHCVLSRLPSVQALLDPLAYVLRCRDMAGPLERHRLKDYETLRVTPPVAHPPQILHQGVYVSPPHLPARRFVASQWNDREVTPPPLALPFIRYPAVQMGARVPMDPVSVDLPET